MNRKLIAVLTVLAVTVLCLSGRGIYVQAASLSVDKAVAQIKEPVTATYSLSYEECEGGWVGVFVKGAGDDEYFWAKSVTFDEDKKLVDNTHTVTFEDPGSYEFRLFRDYFGQHKVATASVEIVFSPSSTISVSSDVVPGNQPVAAHYTISEQDGLDTGGWVGFYKVGAPDDSWITYQETGGKSGVFEVTMPEGKDEQYEFRLFMDYYGVWKLATSSPIRASSSDEQLDKATDSKARFENIRGVVEITPDPDRVDWSSTTLKTVIAVGDHIRTDDDSSARITLEDGSTYILRPNSEIVIRESSPRLSKIGLITGRIWNNARRMFNEGTLEVEMGQAVAGIRGTTLVCEEDKGLSTLKVLDGEVELTAKRTGLSQVVRSGERLSVSESGFGKKETFDIKAEQAVWEDWGAPNATTEESSTSMAPTSPGEDVPSAGGSLDSFLRWVSSFTGCSR